MHFCTCCLTNEKSPQSTVLSCHFCFLYRPIKSQGFKIPLDNILPHGPGSSTLSLSMGGVPKVQCPWYSPGVQRTQPQTQSRQGCRSIQRTRYGVERSIYQFEYQDEILQCLRTMYPSLWYWMLEPHWKGWSQTWCLWYAVSEKDLADYLVTT